MCPVTEYRVKLKEEYLAHLENEELVKATRLTEDQKRKLLQAWREYQRKICEINALVSSSIELLEVDSRVGGIVEDKVMMRAGPTAFAQSTNKSNLSLMAFGKLRSFQKHERQAYFDLIEATFMLTPLQWFHLRLLGLLLSEDSLTGMHLAILRMS